MDLAGGHSVNSCNSLGPPGTAGAFPFQAAVVCQSIAFPQLNEKKKGHKMGQQWVNPTTTCRTKPRTRPRSPADLGTPSTRSPRRSPASPQVPGCCGRSFPGPNAALAFQRLTAPRSKGCRPCAAGKRGAFFQGPQGEGLRPAPLCVDGCQRPGGARSAVGQR